MNRTPYTVGQHLLERLHELGIRHLFSIPGAHCSRWLHDYVEASSCIQRFGTTNALNAGYAADGYARMNGIGAVCVPYSVGGFPLLASIAGSYAERVPVVVINGAPASSPTSSGGAAQHRERPLVGGEGANARVYEDVTCASERISDPKQAPEQIDRALRACLHYSRPVYLEPQADVYDQPCTPAQSELAPNSGSSSPPAEAKRTITDHLQNAESVLIWGGLELQRYDLEEEFDALVRALDAPYVTSLLNKGLLKESHSHFAGILDADAMSATVRELAEEVDYILGLGIDRQSEPAPECVLNADAVTLVHNGALYDVPATDPQRTTVDAPTALSSLLSELTVDADPLLPSFNGPEKAAQAQAPVHSPRTDSPPDPEREMTFQGFFDLISDYIEDDHVLMSGIGFDRFGSQTLSVPRTSGFVCQAAYRDMGYVAPASIGVDLGSDADRVFVFVGDGGFQTMPQCVGTMAEKCVDPVIFVLNNGVYGADQWRTDPTPFHQNGRFFPQSILQHWHYRKLPDALGGRGWRVETYEELRSVVEETGHYVGGPLIIDVRLKQKSLPLLLKQTVEITEPEASVDSPLPPSS